MRLMRICAVLSCACVVPLQGAMRPAAAKVELKGPAETARLVFVRPSQEMAVGLSPYILDGARKKLLGQSINDSYFAVDVEPGQYLLCPTLPNLYAPGVQGQSASTVGMLAPVTRLEVVAGKTYLMQVAISWGPRIELIPARPGSMREHGLLERLPEMRGSEAVVDSEAFKTVGAPERLAEWFELCLESSSDDLRLRMAPEDGR